MVNCNNFPHSQKGNLLDYNNYRGIALMSAVYKIMAAIIAKNYQSMQRKL
jgi:hypothetical protein